MIDFLISKIKLSKRIYLGYFLVSALTLILFFIVFLTFRTLSSDFRLYINSSNYLLKVGKFVYMMNETERQALIYTYEGYDSSAEQVSKHYFSMKELFKDDEEIHEDISDVIQLAQKHLENYHKTFLQVKTQRELKEKLVREELRIHANKIKVLIDSLIQDKKISDQNRYIYYEMLASFLLIETNAYRYFDSLDSRFVERVSNNFNTTQKTLAEISTLKNSQKENLQQIKDALQKYRSTFFEAVQRTRGYLYLVNVVMSAEAYEIMYQTKELSKFIAENVKEIESVVLKNIAEALVKLATISFFLFIIIALFSYSISRSIAIPLNRLTRTFQSLSKGSSDTLIPEYKLNDEIGELTASANSFKERNNELFQKKKELERSNDELEQFVYTVSHDLKSPIVTSMGFIGIIKTLASKGQYEKAVTKLDKVIKSNERMSQLINDLLELSRVGRIDMDKKKLNLNVLLDEFHSSQSERLAKNNFKMTIQYPLPTIYANESRTLQIFENILSNALKYASGNENPELVIGVVEKDNFWQIYCRDNGEGIEKEYHEKIFGLFYRLDANVEGTGIGLAVAKKIMKFHGGRIWVESEPPNGATFLVEFPKIEF
jgi:signal transduction histidine kinase